jgi:DNA invertase Pin-like site-specific DNA recombinase
MARGVKFGRKHTLTPHQQQEAKRRRDAGQSLSEIGQGKSLSEIGRLFGVNYQTIGRL